MLLGWQVSVTSIYLKAVLLQQELRCILLRHILKKIESTIQIFPLFYFQVDNFFYVQFSSQNVVADATLTQFESINMDFAVKAVVDSKWLD